MIAACGGAMILQTSKGHDIPNHEVTEITQFEAFQQASLQARYGLVRARTGLIARYNCHGLVFAARRAWISDSSAIHRILTDDGYSSVPECEVLPGDIILYTDPDTNDIEHSGIVVAEPTGETLNVPLVCSKWGKGWEVVHRANQCPYNFGSARYIRIRS